MVLRGLSRRALKDLKWWHLVQKVMRLLCRGARGLFQCRRRMLLAQRMRRLLSWQSCCTKRARGALRRYKVPEYNLLYGVSGGLVVDQDIKLRSMWLSFSHRCFGDVLQGFHEMTPGSPSEFVITKLRCPGAVHYSSPPSSARPRSSMLAHLGIKTQTKRLA